MNGKYIIYNTASGAIAEGSCTFDRDNFDNNKELLVKNGFLVTDEDEYLNYIKDINFKTKSSPDCFTIIPTTGCNAKCFYCYEEEYCKKSIDEQSRKKIVNYISSCIKDKESFTLDWFGGEPLLCAKEIDLIIADIKENVPLDDKNWTSSITTNATLFTHGLIDHAIKNWHLSIAHITIDGVESDHNMRKNVHIGKKSAYKVTTEAIRYLLKNGVYVNLRIHLDNLNKNSFPDIIDGIFDFFDYPNFNLFPTFLFPPEKEMPKSYIKDIQKEDLFYDVFRILKEKNIINNYFEKMPYPKKNGCFATCENNVVISYNASLHSCVQEFENTTEESEKKFFNIESELGSCKSCKYFPICLGGCLHNRAIENTVRTPCVRNRYTIHPLMRLMLEEGNS